MPSIEHVETAATLRQALLRLGIRQALEAAIVTNVGERRGASSVLFPTPDMADIRGVSFPPTLTERAEAVLIEVGLRRERHVPVGQRMMTTFARPGHVVVAVIRL